ncbi:serine 3-dehydrogenase [Pseudomonas sp. NZIPFR-PS5]|nr:serine 3-dehydrogenase [Pseudomonas sp. NZIPFR-PS5]
MCSMCDALTQLWTDGATSQGVSQQTATSQATLGHLTLDQQANYLTDGYWHDAYGGSQHHFDVHAGGSLTVNMASLSANAQVVARYALQTWTDVSGINFVETTAAAAINFSENNSGAYSSSNYAGSIISTSSVNIASDWVNYGRYYQQTYIHEIGHALGLGHAGNYNGSATFPNDAFYQEDSWKYSVMSYFSQDENTYSNASFGYVATPMLADIVAIQSLYGTAVTRTGDNTYGLNINTGTDFIPGLVGTIYDSGGNDTINVSTYAGAQTIDLRSEAFSSVYGGLSNIAIARGTVIENAITGAGADTLIGNASDNFLNGNAGNDQLFGGDGNDRMMGGAGSDMLNGGNGFDTALYTEAGARYFAHYDAALVSGASLSVHDAQTSDVDTLSSVEKLAFMDRNASVDELLMAFRSRYGAFNAESDATVSLSFGMDLHHIALTEDQADIARLYSLFGRTPDYQGLNYWLTQQEMGSSDAAIRDAFLNSAEAMQRYSVLGSRDFVLELYQTVLHRTAEESGVSYWNTLLQDGLSRTAVIDTFLNSPESHNLSEGETGYISIVAHNAWNNLDMVVGKGVATGTAGDDQISEQEVRLDGNGASHLAGNAGIDTFIFNDAVSAYTISALDTDTLSISRSTGAAAKFELSGFNLLDFADRELFVLDSAQASIGRLYAILDRAPDTEGLKFWLAQGAAGATGAQMAVGFVQSAEFTQRLTDGSSNTAFVEQLYHNVLNRGSDANGLASWVHSLDGGISRGQVAFSIANSAESAALTQGDAGFIHLIGHADWI